MNTSPSPIYPFKFLDFYEKKDQPIFFGRDKETQDLLEATFQAKLILLYGASGTGKTSLIQCGLASQLRQHEWQPIFVRRGKNIVQSLEKELEKHGGKKELLAVQYAATWDDDEEEEEEFSPATSTPNSPLANQLINAYRASFKPLYLVFDQFEELYILGDDEGEEQQAFIEALKTLLEANIPLKIILSIREEYLGHLYALEKAIPQLMEHKLRVETMHLPKVQEVLESINQLDGQEGKEKSLVKIQEVEKFSELLFNKLRGEKKQAHVDLPYLQVFLEQLYLKKTGDHSKQTATTLTPADVEAMNSLEIVLQDFLKDQVNNMAQAFSGVASATIWRLLGEFVTDEGTKRPRSVQELKDGDSTFVETKLKEMLVQLGNFRILRKDSETDTYEVSHDSLAKKIYEMQSGERKALDELRKDYKVWVSNFLKNGSRLSHENMLALEGNKYFSAFRAKWNADEKRLWEASKRRLRRNRILRITTAVFILALAVVAVVFAFLAKKNAEEARESKVEATIALEKQKELKDANEKKQKELEQKKRELEEQTEKNEKQATTLEAQEKKIEKNEIAISAQERAIREGQRNLKREQVEKLKTEIAALEAKVKVFRKSGDAILAKETEQALSKAKEEHQQLHQELNSL